VTLQPPSPGTAPDVEALTATVRQLSAQLEATEKRLQESGITDAATELFSFRYILGRISEEVARADRFNLEVSCLMLTLDHPSAEGLLAVAARLKEACRQYDVPARWGQHELLMLLPATDLDGAQTFAERFRLNIANAFTEHPTLPGLTISLGVASYPVAGVENAEQLLAAADEAAFQARQEGGNRTVLRA
jgi:two-component system, cell cycle response regulator